MTTPPKQAKARHRAAGGEVKPTVVMKGWICAVCAERRGLRMTKKGNTSANALCGECGGENQTEEFIYPKCDYVQKHKK